MLIRSFLTLTAVLLSASLFGCTSTRQVIRSDIRLRGDATQTLDGLTVKARVTDLASMKNDARLYKQVEAERLTSQSVVKSQLGFYLLTPPVFEVKLTNQTGHVVKLSGAVIKLIDAAGNLYDAVPKDKLKAGQTDQIAQLAAQGMKLPASAQSQLKVALQQLKILDENVQLLPDIAETFYVSFELPVEPTVEAVNQWMASQTNLRLKVFEVPTQTNEAGAVTKRVAFEFPIEVKTYQDTYEVDLMGGQKLLSSVEVAK